MCLDSLYVFGIQVRQADDTSLSENVGNAAFWVI